MPLPIGLRSHHLQSDLCLSCVQLWVFCNTRTGEMYTKIYEYLVQLDYCQATEAKTQQTVGHNRDVLSGNKFRAGMSTVNSGPPYFHFSITMNNSKVCCCNGAQRRLALFLNFGSMTRARQHGVHGAWGNMVVPGGCLGYMGLHEGAGGCMVVHGGA